MATCVIFNPTARGEKARGFRERLARLEGRCACKPTAAAGEARALAREAVQEGFDTVVAAGGDGTVNEVLNGIGDAPGGFDACRLGVIPLGTVNVFAREINVPQDFQGAWEVICSGRETRIDLPCVEHQFEGGTKRRHFVQLAGAGLDAMAVHLVSWELKKRIGSFAYVAAGLQAMRAAKASIEVSNGRDSGAGELVLIGNGRYYGGAFPVFRRADFQDGVLDVCVFRRVNWLTLTRYAWSLVAQRVSDSNLETHFQGHELTLSAPTETFLEVDGEWVGSLPATMSVAPLGLRVITGRETVSP